MNQPHRIIGAASLAAALLCASVASTQPSSPPTSGRHTRASLVAETEAIQPGQSFSVAIRLEMEEHWHTYWINPGDSGLATTMEWELPEGFVAGELQWPRPELFVVEPLVSYGYSSEVWLITDIEPPATLTVGQDVSLGGLVKWLECDEICLPGEATLEVVLPVAQTAPASSRWAGRFADVRRTLPADAQGFDLASGRQGNTLALDVEPPQGWSEPPGVAYFFPYDADVIAYAEPQALIHTAAGYRLEMAAAEYATDEVADLRGVLVANTGGPDGGELVLAVDAAANETVSAAIGTGAPATGGGSQNAVGLPMALLFSFLGGLILNLMPCVLPVLSLKVLSLVNEDEDRSRAWRHGLAFTAGVLVFFWILAGSLLALRAAGHQAGWGFQLQSPGFVVFLVFLFFAIGLNLFGVFEVGTGLTTAGGLADRKTGLAGSFWGGALATIVATPCTAPFMGSALGFALGQPAWAALLVFTMLGLGMAAPYMLLTQFPALMRFVPRPGAWMESFKQFMGFLIMGTVAFLLWLFGRQVGVNGMGLLLAGLVVVGLGAWVYGKGSAPGATPRGRLLATGSAFVLAVLGVLIGLAPVQASPDAGRSSGTPSVSGIEWERYSTARVDELRASGTPVFIDFTADWCLTCQVNERVAFTAEVKGRFESAGMVMLKGDWTLRDDEITRALASYGRQGVPVYVLYGRDGQHRLLPELLSPGIVLSALDEAL